MKRLLAAALLAALAACAGEPGQRPGRAKTGLPAPEINLPKLLNAPVKELRGWDELRGKVVVLEFWATWCDPCVESIPGLNALAERFKGKPVVFLHITDESESDVRAFLAGNRIDGWVAPEAAAQVFKAFKVYGRPHTVLIGRDGKVAGFPRGGLSPAVIMGLLAGQPAGAASEGPSVSTGPALAEFYLAPSRSRSGSADYGPASLSASGMPLEYALGWVYGRVDRFVVKPSAEKAMDAAYDIRFSLPAERAAQKKELFLKGLEAALGLKCARVEREQEVYVLKKAPGGPLNVRKSAAYGGASLDGSVLQVRGGNFGAVALRLKEALGEPVFDETGGGGPYEYEYDMTSAEPKAVSAGLQKQLGLRLTRQRRTVAVLEVSGPDKK
ncbi:MAG: hypothetical protein CVU79_09655 [Elusimicrobia bacterium HGW-Elusimicrobia-3]|nr:MAG: hypothetical protein CVU79_09655 [Elusimicrobia bacterium HGW-Elusimicrobia-3]